MLGQEATAFTLDPAANLSSDESLGDIDNANKVDRECTKTEKSVCNKKELETLY